MRRHHWATAAIASMLLTLALGAGVARADTLPVVSGEAAAEVGVTSAKLTGEVDAGWADGDGPTTWRIQYRPEGSPDWLPGNEGTIEQAGSIPVEAIVFGEPGKTYEFRVQAENAAGTAETPSPFPTFTTDAATVPVLVAGPVEGVKYTTATLKGSIDPEGGNANEIGGEVLYIYWSLQYSPKGEGNWQTAGEGYIENAEAQGTDPIDLPSAQLTGLTPGAPYETRLFANYLSFGAETEAAGPDFTTDPVAKPTVAIDPITTFDATTADFSGSVDSNAPGAVPQDPAFDTTWSFSCVPACPGRPQGATIPGDDHPYQVGGEATSLEPNTSYTVTLKATNLGGADEASTSFETPGSAPTVKAYEAGPVQPEQAGINGEVNAHNSETIYWFEWGTSDCSSGGCTALPATRDASAGDGPYNQYVFRELTGLSPGTTYHFRLVAENEEGVTRGPDRTFTTLAAPAPCANTGALGAGQLPDCRAWEMVSPPEKNGGDLLVDSARTQAAVDGNAVAFSAFQAFGDAKGTGVDVEYIAKRDARPGTNGWATHGIFPEGDTVGAVQVSLGMNPRYVGDRSADLNHGIFALTGVLPGSGENVKNSSNLYQADNLLEPGKANFSLLTDSPVPVPPTLSLTYLAGASAGLRQTIFETVAKLTPDAAGFGTKLYESDGGALRLAGRIPVSPETECDDEGSNPCVGGVTSQAGVGASIPFYTPRMISENGSRVLFQSPAGNSGGNIYMRMDGDRTVQINASEKTVKESPMPATLWYASRDGGRVFFITNEGLVDGDSDGVPDLYMYDIAASVGHRLTRLSEDLSSPRDQSVAVVIGASDDGHTVYFAATGQLVVGEEPASGQGLYMWRDGVLTYIGRFVQAEPPLWNSPKTDWRATGETSTARVSSDGRFLAFAPGDGAGFVDHHGFGGYAQGTCLLGGIKTCRVQYIYDADSGRLSCATCDPLGAIATANAEISVRKKTGPSPTSTHLNRALSDNGRRVFFSTAEALVLEDTNGVEDAYVYDTRKGAARLLSSGEDPSPSYFLEASPDGDDAFFVTRERLSGWDVDSAYDLYDARVGGGLPEPPPLAPGCEGDACQPPSIQLSDSTPASASLLGAGNATTPRRPGCGPGKRLATTKNGKKKCLKKSKHRSSAKANKKRRAGR